MNEFVDMAGASGSTYRFKLVPKGATPMRIAGNYAVLRPKGERWALVHLGVTSDLSRVREDCPPLPGRGPFHVYVRLNVARTAREDEHADLLAAHGERAAAHAE